jgi:hypothetical protein
MDLDSFMASVAAYLSLHGMDESLLLVHSSMRNNNNGGVQQSADQQQQLAAKVSVSRFAKACFTWVTKFIYILCSIYISLHIPY